jgi:hypothetical protein
VAKGRLQCLRQLALGHEQVDQVNEGFTTVGHQGGAIGAQPVEPTGLHHIGGCTPPKLEGLCSIAARECHLAKPM